MISKKIIISTTKFGLSFLFASFPCFVVALPTLCDLKNYGLSLNKSFYSRKQNKSLDIETKQKIETICWLLLEYDIYLFSEHSDSVPPHISLLLFCLLPPCYRSCILYYNIKDCRLFLLAIKKDKEIKKKRFYTRKIMGGRRLLRLAEIPPVFHDWQR